MPSKPELFLKLARPDEKGWSRVVPVTDFKGEFAVLLHSNGSGWGRSDSKLACTYNLARISGEKGNRIVAYQLQGFRSSPVGRPIPERVKKVIRKMRCVILGTSNPEADHKDGSRSDPKTFDVEQVSNEDFQPLSKAANDAKRQRCKECQLSGIRFDATRFGYSVSQIEGGRAFEGTCRGCYWHDVKKFNGVVSKNFVQLLP